MMRAGRLVVPFLACLPIVSWAGDNAGISAKSAILIDAGTGKILWQKDANTARFPASTTKIMTGLLLIEHCTPDEIITAPPEIETVKEASMHLKPGEKVRAKDMLYALMLRSANDGCYAVAKHISGSVEGFADLMNERARQIGCTNTNFHNPNGLNDPLHTTSAHDLALIAREAMRYDLFRQVVKTPKVVINRSINWKDTRMVSHNKWLLKDPTADGIKTGYTRPAGHCYVGSATRNGFRVITSILNSDHWQIDHQSLLNLAYKFYEKQDEVKAGDVLGSASIAGGVAADVPVAVKVDAYALGRKGHPDDVERVIDIQRDVAAPVEAGQVLGTLTFKDKQGFEQIVPLVAQQAVGLSATTKVARTAQSNGWAVALGSLMFVGAYMARGRTRRIPYGKTPKTRLQAKATPPEDRPGL